MRVWLVSGRRGKNRHFLRTSPSGNEKEDHATSPTDHLTTHYIITGNKLHAPSKYDSINNYFYSVVITQLTKQKSIDFQPFSLEINFAVSAALRYITSQHHIIKTLSSEPWEFNSQNRTRTLLNTLKKQSRGTSEHAQDLNKSEEADKSSCYLYSVSIPSVQGFICLWVNHKLGYYINSTKKYTLVLCRFLSLAREKHTS